MPCVDLPEVIHFELKRRQAAFRAVCPDARWTRPEGIHLTLKFLGEISDDQVGKVTDVLKGLEPFDKFTVGLKGFGFFPDGRRPRVFWAGVEAPPALAELAGRVEDRMEKLGFEREDRDYRPHLTLARFKVPRPQPALVELAGREKETSLGSFEVSEFFLFESKLSPRGAEYRKVARFPG